MTVHVPLTFRRKGGRRIVISPTGEQQRSAPVRYIDDGLLRSVVQAFEWKRKLDEGEYSSVTELAAAMKLNHSFVSRVLRLTLLAPEIVEAILDGRQAEAAQRQGVLRRLPECWAEQLSLERTDPGPILTRNFERQLCGRFLPLMSTMPTPESCRYISAQ